LSPSDLKKVPSAVAGLSFVRAAAQGSIYQDKIIQLIGLWNESGV
jgi:hypothetical protein